MDGEPKLMWSQVRSYFIPEITDEYQILVIQSTRQGEIPVAHFSPKNTEKLKVRPTLRSFCIDDILSHKTAALQRGGPPSLQGIVDFSTNIAIRIARYCGIAINIVFFTRCSGCHHIYHQFYHDCNIFIRIKTRKVHIFFCYRAQMQGVTV